MTTPAASIPAWARWTESEAYSVGLEEEIMLLAPSEDWSLAQRLDEIEPELSDELIAQVSGETQDAVLELTTRPHASALAAADEASHLRALLTADLAPLGLQAASAGTHPCAVWSDTRIASGERHQSVYGAMRELARREPTFGLHVHVGVTDPESAIVLHNRLRSHLPLLLAMSANSPFWQGRDSGLASVRTPIFQAFPRVGPPRAFENYTEYVETVDRLLRCDAIPDPTYLWWDVRPQPKFGTVEVRIMDAQSEPWATRALAALVQMIARLEVEEGYHDREEAGNPEVMVENRFLAVRDSMDADFIEPVSETRVPARIALERLLAAAAPHAQALGCEAAVEDIWRLADEPGATRQRRASDPERPLSSVVAWLADVF
ncbi:MAG TPA: YbdK family carboxylate-amine ligase [Solirubrobacteraceae bacterium]|jgi:carboxylate-amine ligase